MFDNRMRRYSGGHLLLAAIIAVLLAIAIEWFNRVPLHIYGHSKGLWPHLEDAVQIPIGKAYHCPCEEVTEDGT